MSNHIWKPPLCILPTQKSKQQKKSKKKKLQAQGDTEEEEEDAKHNQDVREPDWAGDGGPPKPKPPEKPDLHSIEQWVREKASRIRRKPGEAILVPELSASGNITASDLCPRCDDSRRLSLSKNVAERVSAFKFTAVISVRGSLSVCQGRGRSQG